MEKLNIKNVFRWIAVLPGAIIAGFLATFPLHWILYLVFAHNGATIMGFEFPNGINIEPIESFLTPFVISITYVLVGYKIAPEHKFKTNIILVILWIMSFISIFLFMADKVSFQARGAGGLLGLFLGLFINWKEHGKIKTI